MQMPRTFIALFFMFTSIMAMAQTDTGIRCDTEDCDSLTQTQINSIETMINKYIENGELSETQAIVAIRTKPLNLEISRHDLERINRYKSLTQHSNERLERTASYRKEEKFAYTLNNPVNDNLMIDKSENYMAFRYEVEEENDIYLSADVRMQNGTFNRDLIDVAVNTIGFGTKIKHDFIVEIGLLKSIAGKTIKKMNGIPEGLAFRISRRWK